MKICLRVVVEEMSIDGLMIVSGVKAQHKYLVVLTNDKVNEIVAAKALAATY